MKPEADLLHVATPRRCNTQQTPPVMQQPVQQPRNRQPTGSLKALADRVVERNNPRNNRATTLVAPCNNRAENVQQDVAPSDGYKPADLQEMDKLLRQLAELEGWTADELVEKLDERRRMAPVRVVGALQQLRKATTAALAPWPEKPAKRSRVELCVIQGGKR